jgi:hypothetical protein
MDDYCFRSMFRREVFVNALNFLESKNLSEKEVVDALKNCIEFFVGGADQSTVRDFCVAKIRTADQAGAK